MQAVDTPLELARRNARRVLTAVSTVAFATSLFSRAIDPIIPPIAADLRVAPETVALLSTAFSLPFALIQPILGPLADAFGKTRIMTVCLIVLIATAAIGAMATSFPALLASRVLAGIAAGGIFPVSLAIVGDLVPVAERQIALGRYLAVVISGNFLGGSLAGVVADLIGWRGVFVVIGCCGAAAFVGSRFGFAAQERATGTRLQILAIPGLFRSIVSNPRAKICYTAVFLEGLAIFGLFPYVALLLLGRGGGQSVNRGSGLGRVCAGRRWLCVDGPDAGGKIPDKSSHAGWGRSGCARASRCGVQCPLDCRDGGLWRHRIRFLHAARVHPGAGDGDRAGSPRCRHGASLLLLLHRAGGRTFVLRLWLLSFRNRDDARAWRLHHAAGRRPCLALGAGSVRDRLNTQPAMPPPHEVEPERPCRIEQESRLYGLTAWGAADRG
jgi:hypothetical protein